jgi:hypothetical protein
MPTLDGRLFVDGLVVMSSPRRRADVGAESRRVAATLRRLHDLTRDWPQRPEWRSSTDLLDVSTGTKIDLDSMPPEAVARCRGEVLDVASCEDG